MRRYTHLVTYRCGSCGFIWTVDADRRARYWACYGLHCNGRRADVLIYARATLANYGLVRAMIRANSGLPVHKREWEQWLFDEAVPA